MEYKIIKLLIKQVSHFNCNACTVFQLRFSPVNVVELGELSLHLLNEVHLRVPSGPQRGCLCGHTRLPANPGTDERVHLVSHFCLKSIERKQTNFNKRVDTYWINDPLSILNTYTCNLFTMHGLVTQIEHVSAITDLMLGLHKFWLCSISIYLLTHFRLNHFTLTINMLYVNGTLNYNINIIKYNKQPQKGFSTSL